MKSSCEDDSKSAFTPNVFPLHWWPGGSWMYRSHWRTAKKILKLLPKTLLQWWEKQGGEFPPQFESWQITGKATELRSGSMISPKIKAGLGSSSKNLSGSGERLSADGFQAQEEPECSSGSTQPQVIKYFTFFFFSEKWESWFRDHILHKIRVKQLFLCPFSLPCSAWIPRQTQIFPGTGGISKTCRTTRKLLLDVHRAFCANQGANCSAKYYSWDWTSANCKNIFLTCG